MHVAVLFDRLGPYHRARLQAAGEQMTVSAVEVAGGSAEYAWDEVATDERIRRLTLFPESDRKSIRKGAMRRAVQGALAEISPDTVAVPGWSHPGALAALQWATQTATPAVMMSETTADDFKRVWWKESFKRRLLSVCGAALVGGTPHRSYLEHLSMPEQRIFLGYDAVQNSHFKRGAERAQSHADGLREDLGMPKRYFMASCRFVPKKNIPRLLKAFAWYREKAPSEAWDLVILGDGPERDAVEQAIVEEGVVDSVHLPGFKQYEKLPFYYGLAEAFVHPSTREQWGLVVNEAMAAGLPVLVSERCGCAVDLVEEEENGFTFDPVDTQALASLMMRIAHGDVNRAQMAAASREIIKRWGPARFAEGLQNAARKARDDPPSSSLFDRILQGVLMYR